MDDQLKERIARPLGEIPSGCFILTAGDGERSTGLLASWVQQAGFEPPMVSVALKRGRPIEQIIEASRHFVLNAVPEDRAALFRHFGRGFALEEPAFDGIAVHDSPAGPVLEDCSGHLECRVQSVTDAGDHRLYIAEVIGGDPRDGRRPYVHVRSNGFKY